MRKRISYFCPWVTTREVIRLGFSGFLFSLLLQLCISGEEEKGKMLKSRRTTYDNSKTCWLTFWKRFGIIGSTVKGSNWCCWQTKFQLKMLTFEYSSWRLKFYAMIARSFWSLMRWCLVSNNKQKADVFIMPFQWKAFFFSNLVCTLFSIYYYLDWHIIHISDRKRDQE